MFDVGSRGMGKKGILARGNNVSKNLGVIRVEQRQKPGQGKALNAEWRGMD